MHNVILSYIISKYTINHIKSSNIIKWLTVIQTERKKERERERITNKKRNRLREWKKERKKKERNKKRLSENLKTPEERKVENITL